jgi:hypothetical protein
MRVLIHLCLLGCFILWLVPLGRFIDRANEDKACGGQRAICQCSARLNVPSPKAEQAQYARAGGQHSPRPISGGGGHELEHFAMASTPMTSGNSSFGPHALRLYALLIDRKIDIIPKA